MATGFPHENFPGDPVAKALASSARGTRFPGWRTKMHTVSAAQIEKISKPHLGNSNTFTVSDNGVVGKRE